MSSKTVAILGAGSWGTALAMTLASQRHCVHLWGHEPEHVALLTQQRENRQFLPGFTLSKDIHCHDTLADALEGADFVVMVVPSFAYRDVLMAARAFWRPGLGVVCATKGIEDRTQKTLDVVTSEVLSDYNAPFAVLAGPSFAREVAQGLPTAVVVASTNDAFSIDVANTFHQSAFRIYRHNDVIGMELAGAVKNILAIATGISDGLGYGANARSALITRGLAEMSRLGTTLGGNAETFHGLGGMGDLVLTCTDNQSRNRRFGLALGAGRTMAEATTEIGQVIEGAQNAKVVHALAAQHQVEMPICEQVYAVIENQCTAADAVTHLLERSPVKEY